MVANGIWNIILCAPAIKPNNLFAMPVGVHQDPSCPAGSLSSSFVSVQLMTLILRMDTALQKFFDLSARSSKGICRCLNPVIAYTPNFDFLRSWMIRQHFLRQRFVSFWMMFLASKTERCPAAWRNVIPLPRFYSICFSNKECLGPVQIIESKSFKYDIASENLSTVFRNRLLYFISRPEIVLAKILTITSLPQILLAIHKIRSHINEAVRCHRYILT